MNRRVFTWSLWDWGSAAINAVIVTFVFGVYLTLGVGEDLPGSVSASSWLASFIGAASLIGAMTAPIFGLRADVAGSSKRMLTVMTAAVVALTAALFFIRDDSRCFWAKATLMAAGLVTFELAQVPYFGTLRQVPAVLHRN